MQSQARVLALQDSEKSMRSLENGEGLEDRVKLTGLSASCPARGNQIQKRVQGPDPGWQGGPAGLACAAEKGPREKCDGDHERGMMVDGWQTRLEQTRPGSVS